MAFLFFFNPRSVGYYDTLSVKKNWSPVLSMYKRTAAAGVFQYRGVSVGNH